MSSFKGVDLFGSGPHRFSVGPMGQTLRERSFLFGSPSEFGKIPVGALDLEVFVSGRLIADDDAGLWSVVDVIDQQLVSFTPSGELLDGRGRSWSAMYLVGFEMDEGFSRGRRVSVGYTASFRTLRVDLA